MIGQKFNRLTVVSTFSDGHTMWNCVCECGETCTARSSHIIHGNVKSCGCYQRERAAAMGRSNKNQFKLPYGEAAFNNLYLRYSNDAKHDDRMFELTKDEFRSLLKGNCYYCDAPPSQEHYASPSRKKSRNAANGTFIYNGIDRLDSTKGYSKENCVSCCKIHNYMKKNLTVEQFVSACWQVASKFPLFQEAVA